MRRATLKPLGVKATALPDSCRASCSKSACAIASSMAPKDDETRLDQHPVP
jgi:hypothetical protein